MKNTKKNLARIAMAAAVGVIATQAIAQSETVIIGLSAPITGNQAQYGQDIKRGAELAIGKLNESGEVPGVTFELAVEDSKGDPQEAANVAQKFAARGDVPAVVGDFSSTASLAASPIYQRAGIVMMTPTASHPDITKSGDHIFRNTPIASSEVGAVTDWAKEMGCTKVAAIGRNDDYGRAYGALFLENAEAGGAEVVGEEYINAETQDLKPVITGLRARGPDCVFLALFQVEAALLFRQAKEMNFTPTFMSGAGLFNPQLIELAGDAANGLLLVSTYLPESDRPEVKSFVDLYHTKFEGVPSKFVAHAYDATNLIANAVKTAGSADPDAVRDALAETENYPGVTGDITLDDDREVVLDLMRLKIADRAFVPWTAE